MKLTCYILDDESHAIGILSDYIAQTPGLELSGSSTSAPAALDVITAGAPDITFADVDMPVLNGLAFAGLVNRFTTIVFTTAYREYAAEAFEKEAADYLLKPFSYERFLQCIQKIRNHRGAPGQPDALFAATGVRGRLIRIPFADICFIEAADHYVNIHTRTEKFTTHQKLAELREKLPSKNFLRIHKSFIVNLGFIRTVEPGQLKLLDKTVLPLGAAYRQAFQARISGS